MTRLDAMPLLQGHESGSEALGVSAGIVPGNGRFNAAFRRAGVAGVAFWGLLVAVLMLEGRRGRVKMYFFAFGAFLFGSCLTHLIRCHVNEVCILLIACASL
jgi:hypothetical protein